MRQKMQSSSRSETRWFVNTFERWRLAIWRAKSQLNLRNFWNQKVSSSNICKKEILVSDHVINVSINLLLTYECFKTCKKNFRSPHINFFVMKCWPAPDLSQTRNSRLASLDIVKPGPDQTIDCHEIFPCGEMKPICDKNINSCSFYHVNIKHPSNCIELKGDYDEE